MHFILKISKEKQIKANKWKLNLSNRLQNGICLMIYVEFEYRSINFSMIFFLTFARSVEPHCEVKICDCVVFWQQYSSHYSRRLVKIFWITWIHPKYWIYHYYYCDSIVLFDHARNLSRKWRFHCLFDTIHSFWAYFQANPSIYFSKQLDTVEY